MAEQSVADAPVALVAAAPEASVSVCAHCGAAFTCGVVAGTPHCWCYALPRLPSLLPFDTCLCPACLERALKDSLDAGISHSPGRHP